MSLYRKKLDSSFVLREMRRHRTAPRAFGNRNVFTKLPVLAEDVMNAMFVVDGKNCAGLVRKVVGAANKYGFGSLMKDLLQIIFSV